MEIFDSTALMRVRVRVGGQLHDVALNFPSDEQWADRARVRPIVFQQLSGGSQKFDPTASNDFDLKLYTQIRQTCCNGTQPPHDPPELDEYEAADIIDKLATSTVTDVRLGAADGEVDLAVTPAGFITIHKLRIPTQRQIAEHRKRANDAMSLPFGKQRIRFFLEPSGKLYDELKIEVRDYNGPVSVLHKQTVLVAMINALDAEGSLPNFH